MAAGKTVAPREIHIRPLVSQADFDGAVQLQKTIWGFEDVDLLPARLFVVASKVGGQAFGAFHQRKLVGFCLAIPALKPGGQFYLHSHMLGVAQEYRNDGIGRLLKLEQRKEALGRNIALMEWTFDPLELKNAYFNIERLGAIIRRYVRNQYGQTTSRLHGGLPTDRCTAEWWLSSERAAGAIAGVPFARPAVEERIAVPADIAHLRTHEPRRAREVQAQISERFEELFAHGLAVTGFEQTQEAGVYCFGRMRAD